MTAATRDAIPGLCACDPAARHERRDGGCTVIACSVCGAEAIALGGALPAFVRDGTRYHVSVELSPAVLRSFVGLLTQKTGLSAPQLLAMARQRARLTLIADQAITVHYALRELAAAGLPVVVEPPYPHDIATDR
jgi:hypothetical protein